MVALVGNIKTPNIYPAVSGYTPALNNRARVPENVKALGYKHHATIRFGAIARNQPITVLSEVKTGNKKTSYLDDFYYRVHINPASINVGNLLSDKLIDFEVWNSLFVQNDLTSISEDATEGLALLGQPTPLLVYKALQSRVYTLAVSNAGPAKINGLFSFNFNLGGYTPVLSVTGLRILAWWARANWDSRIIERWEWLTNVIESRNGKEQRVKLREEPRRTIEYSLIVKNNKERRLLENLLFSWQARIFGLPIWTDQLFIQSELPIGSTYIQCATFSRDYVVGGLVGLFQEEQFEIGNILSFDAEGIMLQSPTTSYWGAGTKVVPMRAARLSDKTSLTRETDTIATMTVQFRLEEPDFRAPKVEAVTYRAYDVLEIKPDWAEDISTDYIRKVNGIDFQTGTNLVDDLSGVPTVLTKYHWLLGSREEIHATRALLFARFGRLVPIWVPTFYSDFTIVSVVSTASTVIQVEHTNYSTSIAQTTQRRDIRIELHNGNVYYRRIVASTVESATVEQLVLNASLGELVQAHEFKLISFMVLSRLDADQLEVSWETDSICKISNVFRSLRDDF